MEEQRIHLNERLSSVYFKLLSSVDWRDEIFVTGLREGLNKFLSNAHIASFPGKNKYHKTHYVTPAALERLRAGTTRNLVWEHLVPKTEYIQRPCELHAREGTLTLNFVRDKLDRFWYLATITSVEDQMLNRMHMPER